MKNLTLLLLLIPFFASPQALFQKEISYTNTLSLSEIIKLPDNGYLGCGYTKTSTIDSLHAIIVRMDSLMQVEWCKRFIILARNDFRCIEALSDGNFLVGGAGRQEFSSYYGATLFKIDGSGNVIWHKLYSNVYDDAALGVFEQNDNSIVLFVRYGVTGQPSKILKTDASGNLLSEIELSTANVFSGIIGDCVTGDGSGNYYMGGTALNSATGKHMHYIAKTSDEAVIWYNEYDLGREDAYLYSITVLSDGNVAAAGNVKDETNTDLSNIAVMKIDQDDGSVVWAKEIKQTEAYFQSAYSIGALENNEMMVCGRANTALGYQAIAVKLSADGEIIWSKEYGEGPYESLGFLNEVSGNRYLFGGRMSLTDGPYFVQTNANGISACLTEGFSFVMNELTADIYSPEVFTEDPDVEPVIPGFEESTLTLTEETICTGTVAVDNIQDLASLISVYPNPADKFLTIEIPEDIQAGFGIELYNLQGKLMHQSVMYNHKLVIETNYTHGIYFITIKYHKEQTSFQQKFIIK